MASSIELLCNLSAIHPASGELFVVDSECNLWDVIYAL